MRQYISLVALLPLFCPASVEAQFPHHGIGGGVFFGYSSRHLRLGGGFGSSYYGGYPLYPGPYYGYAGPIISTTVIVTPPPIVLTPAPASIPQSVRLPAPDPAPIPIDRQRFLVIRPDQGEKGVARLPPAPPLKIPLAMPAVKAAVAKEVDLGVKPGNLPLAQRPEPNARAEADRQIDLGRNAFAAGEIGRALERFKQAILVAPGESSGYFYLAQTQFALGKYNEAVANLEAGLKLRPDWPQSRFRPRDLYGANGAMFDNQLVQLRNTLEAPPEDPRLCFLLGVELWFDGKRDEAKALFERAARRAADTSAIDRFLRS